MNLELYKSILDSLVDQVVFIDTNHVIRYLNPVAVQTYEKRGYTDLMGKSLFDFHSEKSKEKVLEIFQSFLAGEEERFLITNGENKKVYMRAVRDNQGKLIGYYERFE